MKNLELKVRNYSKGNSSKRERKKGVVPGVIYAKAMQNILFEISELELERELSSSGEHGIVNYNISGSTHKGLLKDVCRDPVTHKILHLDIEEIGNSQEIETEVPIIFEGEGYLNNKGQVLQKERDAVKVCCCSEDLPKSINIDVSKGIPGRVYRVSDLEVSNEISIVDDISCVIASISNEKRIISDEMKLSEKENLDKDK